MMKKFWSFLFPSFKGAALRYEDAHGQTAVIHSKSGDKNLVIFPDHKSIALELDSDLFDENPLVTVSERPLKISPFNVALPKD